MSLLEIESLSLDIGGTPILKDVDLAIEAGEVMGLVGESGSGKSMTALTVMRLLPEAARGTGRVAFNGIDILAATEDQMCALRGDDIGMVFQEPMTALNPVKTIGEQVAEGIRWHTGANRADAEARARKMLDRVGLPEAKFPLIALSARAVGRPAAARRHRHRLRAEAEAADRRRADDGARRRAAGADPGAPARSRRREPHGRCCSSRTISRWSPTWPTASRCCAAAR